MKSLQPEVVLLISNITKSFKVYDWHDFVTKNAEFWGRGLRKNRESGGDVEYSIFFKAFLIYKKYNDYCALH